MSTPEQTRAALDEATRALHDAYRVTTGQQRCRAVAAAFRLEAAAWADLDAFTDARCWASPSATATAELLALAASSARRLATERAKEYADTAARYAA